MEFCNGSDYNVKGETRVLPTYLKEYFLNEDEIVLVYDKRTDCIAETSLTECIKKENDTNLTNDLTGDPLKVDLNGDESFGSYIKTETPNNWSVEESTHFPINLKMARKYLNQQNKIKKCDGEKEKPIYVVCDGTDPLHTLIIGAHKCSNMITTTLINIVGCYSTGHEVMSLEAMEMDHKKNTRIKNPKEGFKHPFHFNAKIRTLNEHKIFPALLPLCSITRSCEVGACTQKQSKQFHNDFKVIQNYSVGTKLCHLDLALISYLVKFKYYLYGSILQKLKNWHHSECHGNVSVEVTCNRCVFPAPQNPSSMKMVLQIIVGHNLSSVHFLWEEMTLLQTYIDILADSDQCNDEFTIITKNPIEESDIYKSINNVLVSNLLKREEMKFDLQHLRQEQFLDKLWNILKCCENLATLRDSLHYFFEELVEAETNIKIPETDKSNIATLINGILNGKLAVPTLTFSQALECLFELGAEKLKNDYQAILRNFYSASDQAIPLKWSKFKNEELTSQAGYRKTRVTVNLKSGVLDLNQDVSKLAYLGKLHIATELIFLIKDQTKLPEEMFDYFCEKVYKNYVDKEKPQHDFADVQNSPLCEFSLILNSADTHIIEREIPSTWTMQMASTIENTKIMTTYHLSEYPTFPTVIYNNYDLPDTPGENKMVYYVSKLQSHKEFL